LGLAPFLKTKFGYLFLEPIALKLGEGSFDVINLESTAILSRVTAVFS
jgi:hypothetical protein